MRGTRFFANPGSEHRAEPVPPESDPFVADVHSAFGLQILDIAQGEWVPHVIMTTRRMTSAGCHINCSY